MDDKTSYVTLTDATFDAEVLQGSTPVLVDFWAAWCPPCRALAPTIEALAERYAGRVKVAKLDVEAAPKAAARFAVQSIPTLIFFVNGEEVERVVGAESEAALSRVLDQLLQHAS